MSYSEKFIHNAKIYMNIASSVSKFSKAKRRQVGAIIVSSEGKIVGTGFNGSPQGVDNTCEDDEGNTYEHILHSEINAIFNATTHKLNGSTMFVTMSPCIRCASAIIQKGIKTVIFDEPYRDLSGVDFLVKHGVEVISTLELKSIDAQHNSIGKFLDSLGTRKIWSSLGDTTIKTDDSDAISMIDLPEKLLKNNVIQQDLDDISLVD